MILRELASYRSYYTLSNHVFCLELSSFVPVVREIDTDPKENEKDGN